MRFWKLAAVLLLGAICSCSESGAMDHDDSDSDSDSNTDADADSDSDADSDADSDTDSDTDSDDDEDSDDNALFPSTLIWYKDRSSDPKHPQSDAVIAWMSQPGNGFGLGGEFRMDFSFHILEADASVEFQTFTKSSDFYEGECDYGSVPIPPEGALEGESSYNCEADGDCHLIVLYRPANLLFEIWRANIPGGTYDSKPFYGGCMAVWDLTKEYGWNVVKGLDYENMGRGPDCTSADAAGYPIAPLLFTPEELEAGEIRHALRFVLPNSNIRHHVYVAPSTHSTQPTGGGSDAPPYGAHMRLKSDAALESAHSDVDFNALSKGARVIIKALQTYGMFLSDGGSVALTGASDALSSAKYCDHDAYEYCDEDPNRLLHEHDLSFIRISDFEMLDNGGPERTYDGDCAPLYDYDDSIPGVVDN